VVTVEQQAISSRTGKVRHGTLISKLPTFRAAAPRAAFAKRFCLPENQRTEQVAGAQVKTLLRKVFRNECFPSAVALCGVVLFWWLGMFGGLSLLSKSHPPLETLAWLLFTYACVVLSGAAGLWAVGDLWQRLSRRWKRPPERWKGRPRDQDQGLTRGRLIFRAVGVVLGQGLVRYEIHAISGGQGVVTLEFLHVLAFNLGVRICVFHDLPPRDSAQASRLAGWHPLTKRMSEGCPITGLSQRRTRKSSSFLLFTKPSSIGGTPPGLLPYGATLSEPLMALVSRH